jgi:nucleotide-binding universal stress UspA family protein
MPLYSSFFPLPLRPAMDPQAADQMVSRIPDYADRPILVATDGHPHADTALIAAAFLAGRVGANVQVFSIVEPSPSYRSRNRACDRSHDICELRKPCRTQQKTRDDIATRLARVVTQVALTVGEAAGWPITARGGPLDQTSDDIVAQSHAQLLVIGQCLPRRFDTQPGACNGTHVLTRRAIPIYIAAPTHRGIARRVVIAMDFSVAGVRAAHVARRLSAVDASLYLVHVLPKASAQDLDERRRRLQGIERSLRERSDVRVQSILLLGDAARETLGFADGIRADVVACGTSSLPFLPSTLPYPPVLGRVTRDLIRQASCSMLIAPHVSDW